jgi:fatty acid desaturase
LFSILLIGSFQFALSETLLHEASHYNLFPRRSWNDWAEIAVALPFFRTCRQFREEHKSHHVTLGQEDDPLILDYDAHGLFRPNINITWIWLFKPVLGYAGFYYCSVLLRPWTEGWKIVAFCAAVFPLVVYLGAIKLLLLYWLIPFYWCASAFYTGLRSPIITGLAQAFVPT